MVLTTPLIKLRLNAPITVTISDSMTPIIPHPDNHSGINLIDTLTDNT